MRRHSLACGRTPSPNRCHSAQLESTSAFTAALDLWIPASMHVGQVVLSHPLQSARLTGAYCDFFLDGSRLCRFLGRYPSGTIREEGICEVEWVAECIPMPNTNRTHFGRYYRPDGTLGSDIRGGTGVQTYWNDEGVKLGELELDSLQLIRVTMWDRNGDRIHEERHCR